MLRVQGNPAMASTFLFGLVLLGLCACSTDGMAYPGPMAILADTGLLSGDQIPMIV